MYTCQSDVCCLNSVSFKWSEIVYTVTTFWIVNAKPNVQLSGWEYLSVSPKSPPSKVLWNITSFWQESNPNHSHGQNLLLGKQFFQDDYADMVLVMKPVNRDPGFMEATDCRELVWSPTLLSDSFHSANLLLHITKMCHLICSSKASHANMVSTL